MRILVDLGYTAQFVLPLFRSEIARRARQYAVAAAHMTAAIPATLRAQGADEVVRLVFEAFGESRQVTAAVAALRVLNREGDPAALSMGPMATLTVERYAMLGALDDAYEAAQRIVRDFARTGVVNPLMLVRLWLPELRAFRQDLRFHDLTVGFGLIDYWKDHGPPDNCELRDGRLIVR